MFVITLILQNRKNDVGEKRQIPVYIEMDLLRMMCISNSDSTPRYKKSCLCEHGIAEGEVCVHAQAP